MPWIGDGVGSSADGHYVGDIMPACRAATCCTMIDEVFAVGSAKRESRPVLWHDPKLGGPGARALHGARQGRWRAMSGGGRFVRDGG